MVSYTLPRAANLSLQLCRVWGTGRLLLGSPSSPQTLAHRAFCAVGVTALPVLSLSHEQLTCEKDQQVKTVFSYV